MPPVNPNFHAGDTLICASYYAPRGRNRLYMLAAKLSQRYLYPTDLLIGVIGSEGAGKSTLIKGLFPGLELTNDDEGVNIRPTPIYDFDPSDHFSGHTFHLDVRYELAFRQKFAVVDAINRTIAHGRRVIVEHFDLIFEHLGFNAQILFGLGEEVIVARPTIFGPFPAEIKAMVDKTILFRKMAHSAEDITGFILQRDYNYISPLGHSDIKHGFVIKFPQQIAIDIAELEKKVLAIIAQNLPIVPATEDHIKLGESVIECTGVRTHVQSSGQITNFRLMRSLKYDPISREYMLVGMVGGDAPEAGGIAMSGEPPMADLPPTNKK